MGLVIGDSLIHYLFSNLKRKHCYERTLPDGVIGAIATTGYSASLLVLLINNSMEII
ncbi:hypothetical protein ACWATR_16360 [Nostoc sp. UIC 10890]